jgi:hypothetical protein
MNPTIDKLIDEFLKSGWKNDPFEAGREIAARSVNDAVELVRAAVQRVKRNGFLRLVMSYAPAEAWPGMVETALAGLRINPENSEATEVIANASVEALPSLHPHLREIFELQPNKETYYGCYPWRESGTKELEFLRSVAEDPSRKAEDRERAWNAALETRTLEALEWAVRVDRGWRKKGVGRAKFRAAPDPERLNDYLWSVDHHREGERLRPMTSERVMHLCFPKAYFDQMTVPAWDRSHPTWQLSGTQAAGFGGKSRGRCSNCAGELHRLITFDPVPQGLILKAVRRLELATCMSCLGWESPTRYYRHDESGAPADITEDEEKKPPQFPAEGLLETTVALLDSPPRWRWQDWGVSNGNKHRIGGHPTWVQSAEFPNCSGCGMVMPFLMQLDSELPQSGGGGFMWGSGGVCYIFWCDACRISGLMWQCT